MIVVMSAVTALVLHLSNRSPAAISQPLPVTIFRIEELNMEKFAYTFSLPAPGSADVMTREFHYVVDGVEAFDTLDVGTTTHRLVFVEGATVDAFLIDIDNAGNRSEPSTSMHFVVVDTVPPKTPASPEVLSVEEVVEEPAPVEPAPEVPAEPAPETPVVEEPAPVETPVEEPVAETPVEVTPEAPAEEPAPVVEEPVAETPVEVTPEAPAADPVVETPVETAPEAPVAEEPAPVVETTEPVVETPVVEEPAAEMPVETPTTDEGTTEPTA
jgi:hypothetical protein